MRRPRTGERRINVRHLAVFRAVMRSGSVSAGARTLNISQPAVTKSLQAIEAQIGVPLFRRIKGRLQATSEAGLLMPKVDEVFRSWKMWSASRTTSPARRLGASPLRRSRRSAPRSPPPLSPATGRNDRTSRSRCLLWRRGRSSRRSRTTRSISALPTAAPSKGRWRRGNCAAHRWAAFCRATTLWPARRPCHYAIL